MATELRSFVVHGGRAGASPGYLGPTSWAVLEELVAHSSGRSEESEASASVRSLGAALGLSKDTISRSLGRLRAAGVVAAIQPRAAAGADAAGFYRIAMPSCFEFSDAPTPVEPSARPRRLPTRVQAAQLSLLDPDPTTL
jgi:hypothetical protein